MGPTASLVTVSPVISLVSGGPPTLTSPVYATVSPSLLVPVHLLPNGAVVEPGDLGQLAGRGEQGPGLPPRGQRRRGHRPAVHFQPGSAVPAEQPGQHVGRMPADGHRRTARPLRADTERVLGALRPHQAPWGIVPPG